MKYFPYTLCMLFSFCSLTAYAQVPDQGLPAFLNQNNNLDALAGGNGAFYVKPNSDLYVNISPKEVYLDPEWQDGEIVTTEGEKFVVPLRYRVADDAFEFRYQDQVWEINNAIVRKISLADKTFLWTPYRWKGQPMVGYLQVLYTGNKYRLMLRHFCLWQEPRRNEIFNVGEEHKSLKRKSGWIIVTPDGQHSLRTTTGAAGILRKLGLNAEPEAKAFIREHKLEVSETAHLIQLLEWLDKRA